MMPPSASWSMSGRGTSFAAVDVVPDGDHPELPVGELLRQVFPGASSEIVVDTYVHYLRRKLGEGAVVTVRGRGYRLGRA